MRFSEVSIHGSYAYRLSHRRDKIICRSMLIAVIDGKATELATKLNTIKGSLQ